VFGILEVIQNTAGGIKERIWEDIGEKEWRGDLLRTLWNM